jgi:Fe-S cluster biogenesis protein NfuA
MSEEEQERLELISELLDQRIRPSLQADGGDLHVVGLSGNYLSIHYQGACGSCPSSISGTLAAIENLVRTIEPELAVVSV